MRQRKRRLNRRAQRIFIRAIRRGPRRALVHLRSHRHIHRVLRNVLVNGVVGEARQRANRFIDVYFRLRNANGFGQPQHGINDVAKLTLGSADLQASSRARFSRHIHCSEKAVPIRALRNRAGDAPWPVPIVCIGWPFPQFGVPHSVQCSRSQIASHEFQNSVVIPL